MRIINRTLFDTRSLRSVLCAALRADEKEDGRLPGWQRDGLRIVVVHARYRNRVSGYATYNGTRMRLRLPDDPSLESVVWLFLHELAHIRGEHHRQMSDTVLHRMAAEIVAANPGLALRPKTSPTPKAKPPMRLVRYEHAKAMLEAKERAAARIKRQADKWRRKVRYYERAMRVAAATQPPKETDPQALPGL